MASLVSYAECILRPGFENADQTQLEAVLDDVSALARLAARGELDAAAAPLPDSLAAVRTVIIQAARRGLTNPRGLSQEQLGDYGYTSGGSAVASIYLTQREKQIIRRAVSVTGWQEQDLEGYINLEDPLYMSGTLNLEP